MDTTVSYVYQVFINVTTTTNFLNLSEVVILTQTTIFPYRVIFVPQTLILTIALTNYKIDLFLNRHQIR